MTKMFSPIQPARVSFDTQGTPESALFGDIYFSRKNGIAESTYVFLEGNELSTRFSNSAIKDDPSKVWIIAETGFGTGLNFLLTAALFLTKAPSCARLHFVSFEKYPLQLKDLEHAISAFKSSDTEHLHALAEQLYARYPTFVPGLHRLHIHPRITLDIHFGDVLQQLPSWVKTNPRCVDAWFLDGFAPRKNPGMWQPELYRAIAISMATQATLATFTATGHVRRGLQRVGVTMRRRPGFGRKRDMLIGKIAKLAHPPKHTQAHALPFSEPPESAADRCEPANITIVGDGIAAASLLYALRNNPQHIHLYSQASEPAAGASGNAQGAVYPLLQADWTPASNFFSRANDYALAMYRDVAPHLCHISGVQQLLQNQHSLLKVRSIIGKELYPTSIWQALTQTQASRAAHCELPAPAVLMAKAGWVQPQHLVQQIFAFVQRYRQERKLPLTVRFAATVKNLKPEQASLSSAWLFDVVTTNQYANEQAVVTPMRTQQFILATGAETNSLLPQELLPIRPVRGQITQLRVPERHPLRSLQQVICHSGYLTPVHNNSCCIGATFDKTSATANYIEQDNETNVEQQIANLGIDFSELEIISGRAGVRATTPDHLPMVGRVPFYQSADVVTGNTEVGNCADGLHEWQNLWVLTGLGARGLTSAPLAAELLANLLENQPLPLHLPLVEALAPDRFAKRALIRKQPVFVLQE
ncbi:bifunctional tRNA (5-methylaminomethyl-2-thiouridine)(34)-methyltransferase MnmD/FAD-dependent 5-carboxymethylaminomethyl-2-thiouridine(34) oxidoreductase MnmC [Aliidiomarina sp.]|uniref:bifunctional tRNA (5-methylaminomethyl-2-thiouridine)(34)-methyltransferase MnmD/FAD-dependent 5-carboxymethylaminomethyl-2-thiouridine(34) oxidoreductase MnmC n=1 Tax=Aliidiomarina sp. TaxID=1872439 RepID=UPI003A4D9A7E